MNSNKLSASLEDYLEAIYQIIKNKKLAHAIEISKRLGVGKSSVSWALNQLSHKKLINYAPYEAITLTDEGTVIAKRVAERHESLKTFLMTALEVDEQTAEENACRLEHVLDKSVMDKIRSYNAPNQSDETSRASSNGDTHYGLEQTFVIPKTSKERDQDMLERLNEVLEVTGQPLTDLQQVVAKVFMASESHQTVDLIYQATRPMSPEVTPEIVEQTLDILCEHKIARSFLFKEQVMYEHDHPESHHDHLFCVKCGAIVEFFDPRLESLQEENAEHAQFRMLRHTLNIFGVCEQCVKMEEKTRRLDQVIAGETVEVVRMVVDKATRTRLASMGLAVKRIIQVLNDQCTGDNMILLIGGSRLMIEKKMARKVKVIPAASPKLSEHTHHGKRGMHRHLADRMAFRFRGGKKGTVE